MKIERQFIGKRHYGESRSTKDIRFIVVRTIDNNAITHYHIIKGTAIQKIPDEYMSDAINGGKVNKYAYLHGICTKYNSLSIGVPSRMSQDDKQMCINLIMTLKQRYKIKDDDIVRQFDVTGDINPEEWYDAHLWHKDIKNKLIDI